ncbi:MAG: hypothetical protein Q8O91_05450 [Candidatus Aminicenantes bacterium]|nr:hypothetical protein [Candidatus Aminicenantes bacterium]
MGRLADVVRIACVVLLVPAAASAQLRNAVIHGHAGYAFQEAGSLRGGLETGFGFAYPFAQRFWISIEFSRWKAAAKGAPHILQDGTVTVSPIIACLQYEFLANKFFIPYAFAGGALVFASFEIGPYVSIPEVKIKQTIENGPAYDLGVGARIPLSRTVSFFSEVSYLVRKGWGKTIIRDMNLGISQESIVVNLKTVFIKFGLKFYI